MGRTAMLADRTNWFMDTLVTIFQFMVAVITGVW
jgi:hypothetical protein